MALTEGGRRARGPDHLGREHDGVAPHTAGERVNGDGIADGVAGSADPAPSIRRATITALAKMGSPRARDALLQACEDQDREVRLYATEGLTRLGR